MVNLREAWRMGHAKRICVAHEVIGYATIFSHETWNNHMSRAAREY